MRKSLLFPALALASLQFSFAQEAKPLDAPSLKAMIKGLGYETKDLNVEVGKEKYEFTLTTPDLNIPVGAEISPSKNYVWLTVFLGASRPDLKFEELLKSNASTQPCFFYITSKSNLMMAVALDNRMITPTVMKRNIEMLTKSVTDTKSIWMKPN